MARNVLAWKPRGIIGSGPQGPKGEDGASIRVADIDVMSGQNVDVSHIRPNTNIQEGDILLDINGQLYYIVNIIDANTVHVSSWLNVSVKGPKGDRGSSIHASSRTIAENSPVDYQFFSNNEDVRKGDVVMDREGRVFEIYDVNTDSRVAYVGRMIAQLMPSAQEGLQNAYVNDDGHLILVMRDGTTIDAGDVRGGVLRFGTGAPPSAGVIGDTWIDVLTGDCYQYENV